MGSNWIHALLSSKETSETKRTDAPMTSTIFHTPGDIITSDGSAFICGHGTYLDPASSCIVSSVAGNVEYINKLIRVVPPKTRYQRCLLCRYLGEVGDVVVGRITSVCQKKWIIDLNAQQPATLQLAAIYLPGNIQRRKLEEDELQIRQFFVEGDLVSAEVQSVRGDGSVAIHTRSIKYGKLCNGLFLSLDPRSIQRSSSHFVSLSCGVDLILGINGYIWIGLPVDTQTRLNTSNIVDGNPYALPDRLLSSEEMMLLSRIRNCLLILNNHSIPISETSIMKCYESSFISDVPSLLKKETGLAIATQIKNENF